MKRFFLIFFCLISLLNTIVHAYIYIPLYDHFLNPSYIPETKSFFVNVGGAIGHAKGYNLEGHHINPLQILDEDQNTLSMLNGFSVTSMIGIIRNGINAFDDGTRGHMILQGDLTDQYTIFAGFTIPLKDCFFITAYLPFYGKKLSNLTITDNTLSNNAQDIQIKETITNNIKENIFVWSDGLMLEDWTRNGVGDLTTFFCWEKVFEQDRPILKLVELNARVGISFPTAKRRNEDLLCAYSFGYDGAWAIPFGASLHLYLGSYFTCGLDINLTYIAGSTRLRRIKTDVHQTELFLLAKTKTRKQFGMQQHIGLYASFHDIIEGFSVSCAYNYDKHSEDSLALRNNEFIQSIANSAKSLEESSAHHFVIDVQYDCANLIKEDARAVPYIGMRFKLPFNGRNAILSKSLQVQCGVMF